MELPTRTVTATCLCKSVHFTLTIPTSCLPISAHMCHCSRCRYTHGTMCITHVPLPKGIHPQFMAPSSLEESVTRYWFDGAVGDRRFCKTCGCYMGDFAAGFDMWYICPALFDKDESVFLIDEHIYTRSGPSGLADWLPCIGERTLKVTNPDDGTAEPQIPKPTVGSDGEDRLLCECHCGGVSLTIRRPTADIVADQRLKYCVSGGKQPKWKAHLDVGRETRLINGVHIGAWMSVLSSACEPEVTPDLHIGTAVAYAHSSKSRHYFCRECGATLFRTRTLQGDRTVPFAVDIAVGIARAPEGVRAENWVAWQVDEFEGLEEGVKYDRDLYTSLSDGFRTWVDSVKA